MSDAVLNAVLDAEAISHLAAEHAPLAAALTGRRSMVTPTGGHRLARLTLGSGPRRPTATNEIDPQRRRG